MTSTAKAARERRPPQPTRRKTAMFKGSALLGSPALPRHPSTLKGKVAIVTGSTSGIGLGIAQALACQGVDIVLNGFGEHSEIKAIRAGIEREYGVRVVHDGADMSKAPAVHRLVGAAIEKLGGVESLVHNPGSPFPGPVENGRAPGRERG